MGLFKDPLKSIAAYLEQAGAGGRLRETSCDLLTAWPEKSSLVLQEDTAVELGGSRGSLFMFLWSAQPKVITPGRISLIGPDLLETGETAVPLTQIVLVKGSFENDYETYQQLSDAVFDTRLEGVSTRIWPDRQKIWCRVSKDAMDRGFSLMRYGATLINSLNKLTAVDEVEVIFATEAMSKGKLLAPAAEKVQDIVEALLQIYEDTHFDCETCEYSEVCEEVEGLREIHEGLRKERDQS